MKRINNVSKNLAKNAQSEQPNAPSMSTSNVKVDFKPINQIHYFIKNYNSAELEPRAVGIYKLVKLHKGVDDTSQVLLKYKLGKTKYVITSCRQILTKGGRKTTDGTIEITKNFFQTKVFQLNELPKEVVDSINSNINKFNEEYEESLRLNKLAQDAMEKTKAESFFNGLDM